MATIRESYVQPVEAIRAYIAGFFDGEGSLSPRIRKKGSGKRHGRGSYTFTAGIHQVDPRPLKLIHSIYGGIVVHRDRSHLGNRANIWLWQLTGRQPLSIFLADIRPWLIVKKDQVDIFFSAYEIMKHHCRAGTRYTDDEANKVIDLMFALKHKNRRGKDAGR